MSNVGKIVIIGTSFPYIYRIVSETPKGFKGNPYREFGGRGWSSAVRQVMLDQKPYAIVDTLEEAERRVARIKEIDKEARAFDEKQREVRQEQRFYPRQLAVLRGEPEFGIKADERDLANG